MSVYLTIPFWIAHVSYVLIGWLLIVISRPAYLAFRRKRSGYGTVFNSTTGEPIELVRISLRDVHGRIVRSVVTDKKGRYRLIVPKGEYFVEVIKEGFRFPSAYVKQQSYRLLYDRLLPSSHVFIQDFGALTKNIAVDPIEPVKAPPFYLRKIFLSKTFQYGLAFIGPLIMLGFAWPLRETAVVWMLFGLYLAVFIRRIFSFRPAQPPYGTIRDQRTGLPLPGAEVRLFEKKSNKLLETQIMSPKARYAFLVRPGTYRLMVSKKGYTRLFVDFPNIVQDGFLIAKDLRLRPKPMI